jgi:RNA polymerase sigma-70 factor (sigma-E family)
MAREMSEIDQAFSELVRTEGDRAFRLAVLLTGDLTAGQDLLQTVHEQIYRHYRRHGTPDSPAHYLRAALIKAATRSRRLQARRRETLVSHPPETAGGSAESRVLARHHLLPALRRLPPRQRAVIVLRYFADMTEADTAKALGCSIGTVKTQAHRALQRLRAESSLTGITLTEV